MGAAPSVRDGLFVLRRSTTIEGVTPRRRHGLGLAPLLRLGQLIPKAIEHVVTRGRAACPRHVTAARVRGATVSVSPVFKNWTLDVGRSTGWVA